MSEAVVYQIRNKVNGKRYIGSTRNKQERWSGHKSSLRYNKHHNSHLQNSFNKYGSENFKFTVMEEVGNVGNLIKREQYYIDNLDPEYNVRLKADNSELTEEHKRKIGKSERGKEVSKEARETMSEAHKNPSEEIRKKYRGTRAAVRGGNNPQSKLTEKKVKIIKHLLNGDSFTQKQIGKMFGVVRTTITAISRGKGWSHIEI